MQLVQPASQWDEIFCKGAFLFSQDIYKNIYSTTASKFKEMSLKTQLH